MNFKIPGFTTSIIDAGFTPEDEDTKKLYREVGAFAKQGQPIVIFGPTGSGKEFLARHYYNTLIKAEFYTQNREKWPSRFEEIRSLYSSVYPEESLNVFLNSIKAGVFQTINSANIYPNLAESILFGHEAKSFTDATTSPGLLETIKFGVLFMDEIGELPKPVQAKLLRAVDSEISEGSRLSGRLNYSLRDVIIIAATNRPKEKMRNDFYYKLGIEVNIKGIYERPKDVMKAIPFFIAKAIGKRKDYALINNIFGITGLQNIKMLSESEEVKCFAEEQAMLVAGRIVNRVWPGNFRALRTAIEASIFRVDSPRDLKSFSDNFRKNLQDYLGRYSEERQVYSSLAGNNSTGHVFPTSNPGLDRRILEEIDTGKEFQGISNYEKKILSLFLSSTHEKGFFRKDLEEYYRKHEVIRHTSEAHIRGRITRLLTGELIEKTGTGKTTAYFLKRQLTAKENINDLFALPGVNSTWIRRKDESEELGNILKTTNRIFVQAPSLYGKTAFVAMFCEEYKKEYNFYYYSLGEGGAKRMFEDIASLIKYKKTGCDQSIPAENCPLELKPFLDEIFVAKDGNKPVLIIDNANFISDRESFDNINNIAAEWQNIIIILCGETMDNALIDIFHEFRLISWSKQA